MDEVFRALKDASRRQLLDALFARDGQTLGELCEQLPEMSRYGVMNHLAILEDGGLVTTRRDGRRKLHYLNPVPIRLVHDRWIDKYTRPIVGSLSRLTNELDQGGITMSTPTHVHETYIRCAIDDAWKAIVDGDTTVRYYYGTRVESDFDPGSPIRYLSPGGDVVADGEILAIEEPHRLELSFHPRWDPVLEEEGSVHMAWLLETVNGLTRVRVEYYDLSPDTVTWEHFIEGIPLIVAGLKTVLETGEPLMAG